MSGCARSERSAELLEQGAFYNRRPRSTPNIAQPRPLTTALTSPSTSAPPGQNPPTSHTQSQSSPSHSDPGSAPSSPAPSPATAAPPSHSDQPTSLRLPYSARPVRSEHSSRTPDPPVSPPTSFPQSPSVRTSRSGRYPVAVTASARGYTSAYPSAAPRSRLPAAPAAACNSTPTPATPPPAHQSPPA